MKNEMKNFLKTNRALDKILIPLILFFSSFTLISTLFFSGLYGYKFELNVIVRAILSINPLLLPFYWGAVWLLIFLFMSRFKNLLYKNIYLTTIYLAFGFDFSLHLTNWLIYLSKI